jgi:RND family efflux transporter MFP subunit
MLLVCACASELLGAQSGAIALSAAQREAFAVRSEPPARADVFWSLAYPAKVVVPNAQLRVLSVLRGGTVEALLVAEGEQVEQGQVLAHIRSAELLQEQRDYLVDVAALGVARKGLERDRQLFAEGVIAERRLQETEAQFAQAQVAVSQGRQGLALSGMDAVALAALERERRLESRIELRAPLAGTVLAQRAVVGEHLEPAQPLYEIGSLNPLWVEIHVPLDVLGQIAADAVVRVAGNGVEGRVITVGSRVHTEDQGVLVRAEVAGEAAAALRPGQFAEASVALGSASGLWRVPRSALVRNAGAAYVFLDTADAVQVLAVQVVAEEAATVILSAALSADTRVVTAGAAALKALWLGGE